MTDEPTLKQYNFLNSKGKYVEGMTKQQAHEAIAKIIPAKTAPPTSSETTTANAETVPMNPPVEVTKTTTTSVDLNIDTKPKKSYELTDGNIRIGALQASDGFNPATPEAKIELAVIFEEYIRNGN